MTSGALLITQVDVKNRWADGSIRHALASFRASLPPKGGIHVDFVRQSVPNNAGYLDKAGMLNYNGGSWGAAIEVTNGSALRADARSMLSAWSGQDDGSHVQRVRY